MASSTVSWGIEVGASSIKALKLEAASEGQAKVIDFAVVQHAKPLSTPGVDANDVIRVSLGQLTSQHDLSKATIAVSVPGHSAFARFAKLPPVEPKKVPDIVKFEAMQQIPFPLEQVEWDYQTFVTPDSPEIEVGIFAIHRDRVMERLAMLQDVGLVPNHVVLSPIAVYNALAYDLQFDNESPGTIIVDVGTTSTDLVIATPGRVWVRTFPIGGHQFTEALVNQFQLTYPKAEKLKREAEDTKHARQVFQAMRPIFTDLAQDIQRSIGYFQSLNKDANLSRLIGVGSTFELPGLRKYLKQQLSLDVYRIEQFKRITVEGDRAQAFNTASLNLCTCYGLALQGLGMNTVGGNLMPVSVVRESMWKEKVSWFGLAAGLAVVGSVGLFARPWLDKMAIAAKPPGPIISQVVSRFGENKRLAEEAGVLSSGEPDLRAANAVALFDGRDVMPQILDDMGLVFAGASQTAVGWPKAKNLKNADGSPMADVPGSAFALSEFSTKYLPAAAAADPLANPMAGEQDPDPLKIAQFPRVQCRLEVTTGQPESRAFARVVFADWLQKVKKDAQRAGVSFVVKCADNACEVSESGRSDADPLAGGEVAPRGGAQAGRRRGGGAADGIVQLAPKLSREDERAIRDARRRAGPTVGGAPSESSAAEQSAAAALMQLDQIAALDTAAAEPTNRSRVTITWYAVFMPPEAQAGGENGGSK
ncbi:MAG: type IV pilus assembly protein PilM [Phycisphaerales bacterium]